MPLYSLLTRGILRLDFARVCGASFSRVKNGFIKLMMPMAAIIAKAGAKSTSRRTIEVAKYSEVTAKSNRKMFLLVGFRKYEVEPDQEE